MGKYLILGILLVLKYELEVSSEILNVFEKTNFIKDKPMLITYHLEDPECQRQLSSSRIINIFRNNKITEEDVSKEEFKSLMVFRNIMRSFAAVLKSRGRKSFSGDYKRNLNFSKYWQNVTGSSDASSMDLEGEVTYALDDSTDDDDDDDENIFEPEVAEHLVTTNFISTRWRIPLPIKVWLNSAVETKKAEGRTIFIVLGAMFMRTVKIGRVSCPNILGFERCKNVIQKMSCVKTVYEDQIHHDSGFNFEGLLGKKINDEIKRRFGRKTDINRSENTKSGKDIRSEYVPNDPLYKRQRELQHGPGGIRANRTWPKYDKIEVGTGDKDKLRAWVVAVIDTGFDMEHEDLQDVLWKNEDEICSDNIDNDNNGMVDDCFGWNFSPLNEDVASIGNSDIHDERKHGTAVASIIAAKKNNGEGLAGVCSNCKILPIKVGDGFWFLGTYLAALDYALTKQVGVVNYSAGGAARTTPEEAGFKKAESLGTLIVTAAGNTPCNLDSEDCNVYPAESKAANVITIGALHPSGRIATFSAWSPTQVDMFAPGTNITVAASGGGYGQFSGTSAAAPFVVGTIAYARSRFPMLTITEIKSLLLKTCRRSRPLNGKCVCGGALDMERFLNEVDEWSGRHYS